METARKNKQQSLSFTAGLLSGFAGWLVFLALHALWIIPIWEVLPLGLIIVAAGGLAVGWSYHYLNPHLPARPWKSPALAALILCILLPSMILRELREPLVTITGMGDQLDGELAVSTPLVVAYFVGELLFTATLTGGLLGWWIGKSRQAAIATAVAGFCFALGPGHNIPFLGGLGARILRIQIAIMLPAILVSALVLVETHHWLNSGRQHFVLTNSILNERNK